jgi:oligopeptide/dipeptide ABC transporter ATP-binding protein
MKPILHVEQLSKQFHLGKKHFHAVKNISFILQQGEILGLGGESGCGKSTIGKLLMGLLEPTSGSIFFDGQPLQASREWRKNLQMIFQHPATSLNPRFTIQQIIEEPFVIHRVPYGNKDLIHLLHQVGLTEEILFRLPCELSGGQKQRIAIARALALEPRFLICDEPFSSLDVSVQSQIINLLSQLQKEKNLTYLVISHDLSVLRYLTHQMAIMYLGEIVEIGPSEELYKKPRHPYSEALISAVLLPDPQQKQTFIHLKGEVPNMTQTIQGCPFASRCPYAQPLCHKEKPLLRHIGQDHFAACHFA